MPVGASGCTCSPFEEGSLRGWICGLVAHPLGWGVKRAGVKKLREMGSLLGYLTAREQLLYCLRV